MENLQNDEREIDLRELFFALKKRILWIIAAALLCGCVACAYTQVFITPIYTSTSSVLVISKETTLTSIADLQLGTELAKDYEILIKSTPVLEEVIENLGLDMDKNALKNSITVTNPADTRILNISVTNTDPGAAKEIVDQVAQVSSEFVGDKMEVVPPKITEEGEIPISKTAPSVTRNALLGLMAGLVLSAGIVIVLAVMNDTIKSEDDITRYLGISTLAAVPDRKDFIGQQNKKAKKKAKSRGGKK